MAGAITDRRTQVVLGKFVWVKVEVRIPKSLFYIVKRSLLSS